MQKINTIAVGFSLVELMVVITIIGILAVFATGAYDSFRANARRAEAKQNLNFLAKLQTTYLQQKDRYWSGDAATNGSCSVGSHTTQSDCTSATPPGVWTPAAQLSQMTSKAGSYGYRGGGNTNCDKNALGFRVNNCSELRYQYWIQGADSGNYVAVAYAHSDVNRWLYPRCTGEKGPDGSATVTRSADNCNDNDIIANNTGVEKRHPDHTTFTQGDAWCTGPKGNQVNFVDIVETCE